MENYDERQCKEDFDAWYAEHANQIPMAYQELVYIGWHAGYEKALEYAED